MTGVDQELVERQVDKILESRHFSAAARLQQFLRYVVNESLIGNGDRLKGYTIGLEVFERAEDFDPQVDTIVRVQAGKLRQRLDLYYADEGRSDDLRILIPKGSYAPVFQVGEGEAAGERGHSQHSEGAGAEARIGGIDNPALIVMPFDNLSGDDSQAFFVDGITEEITNALARFRDLKVVAGHAARDNGAADKDFAGLAKTLGVDFVLGGSVRKAGGRVRVTAQLVEARSGEHLMSENFDRDVTPDNLIDIQDEIAVHVAAQIAEPSGVISHCGKQLRRKAGTERLSSYEAVLAAYEYWRDLTVDSHAENRERLERVVAHDPSYASAWGMLAAMYVDEYRGINAGHHAAPLDKALEAAQKAVRLDQQNATGHVALAITRFHRGEIEHFRKIADRAIRLNPGHPYHLVEIALLLACLEDWEQANALVDKTRAVSLNPVGFSHAVACLMHYRRREFDKALEAALQMNRIEHYYWIPLLGAAICGQLGLDEKGSELVQEVMEIKPDFPVTAGAECAKWNLSEEMTALLMEGWRKAGFDIPG